jgi:hypothetical protein
MQEWIKIYVLSLGIILVILGAIDFAAPAAVFKLWKRWVARKSFFLHGLLLIIAGLPLTISQGTLSWLLLIIGLVPVLMGPFILIYPEKFRTIFIAMSKEMSGAAIKKMFYAEGALLMAGGTVCIANFFL